MASALPRGERVGGEAIITLGVEGGPQQRVTALLREVIRSARNKGCRVLEADLPDDPAEIKRLAAEIGYPVMLRAAYALGGLGSGLCGGPAEVRDRASRALAHSDQVLVEEFLTGWKEIEYEVVRDAQDNCITICSMENVDPMGIHTGESIVVAPTQTLDDAEAQMLRDVALRTIRHLGIVGECNIQYALDPRTSDYRVIEVNPRLSRSSALASKATGFPIAKIAAKLAVGYTLDELRNDITGGATPASFEPTIDYVVVKVPRWAFEKFPSADRTLTTQMKSVGEAMSIGRTFKESLQKALRSLETGSYGFEEVKATSDELKAKLKIPNSDRIWYVAQALRNGMSVEEIFMDCSQRFTM